MNKKIFVIGVVLLVVGVILFAFGYAVGGTGSTNLSGYSAGTMATSQINITSNSSVLVAGAGMYLVNNSMIGGVFSYSSALSSAMKPTASMNVGILDLKSYSVTPGLYYVVYAENNSSTPTSLPSGYHYTVSPIFGSTSATILGIFVLVGLIILIIGIILTVMGGIAKPKGKPSSEKEEQKPPEAPQQTPPQTEEQKTVSNTEEKTSNTNTGSGESAAKGEKSDNQPASKKSTPGSKSSKSSKSTKSNQKKNQ